MIRITNLTFAMPEICPIALSRSCGQADGPSGLLPCPRMSWRCLILLILCALSVRSTGCAHVEAYTGKTSPKAGAKYSRPPLVEIPRFVENPSRSQDCTRCHNISQYSGNSGGDVAYYARVMFDGGRLSNCRVELFRDACGPGGAKPKDRAYLFPLEYLTGAWESKHGPNGPVGFKSVFITCHAPTVVHPLAFDPIINATGTYVEWSVHNRLRC